MNIKFIDSHTHVQFKAFLHDFDEVIRRAFDWRVGMINVGTQKDTSARAVKLTRRYPEGVWAAVGLHPIHTEKAHHDPLELDLPSEMAAEEGIEKGFESRGEPFDYEYYKKLASDPKVVAIGECGLDYYRLSAETKAKQIAAFEAQIQLADEIKKPLMIHCRMAFEDLIKILKDNSRFLNSPPGALHFFTGNLNDAKELFNMGFVFTFGGIVTFSRSYDEIIENLPLEHILLETDAPYVTPTPHRGKRNEPSYITEVAKKIAEIKKLGFDDLTEKTTENAARIFNLEI